MIVLKKNDWHTMDASEAVASVAYRMSELVAIYPITPATPMSELCDAWAAESRRNVLGTVPEVIEMQSEGGVAGALHGCAMGGTLTVSFTSSQGLLLMIPSLYRIAGELTPMVIHVASRAVAAGALSIFVEHSDVMACRQSGVAMLVSSGVQEAQDMAAAAHAATLRSRLPFIHFFDGFRTSHEVCKVRGLDDVALDSLLDRPALAAFRARGLTPDKPTLRGTTQGSDTFFQSREVVSGWYQRCPEIVESVFCEIEKLTGRAYKPFEYEGHPEAERVIVIMGSAADTVGATVEHLARGGEKVGMVKVRLYRPFDARRFLDTLPASVTHVAVLDRTKEPGASGEPLFLDVLGALSHAPKRHIRVVGGRYGIGAKEFEPCMVKAVLDMLAGEPRESFTVGIDDDLCGSSIKWDPSFVLPMPGVKGALFYGLGSDGTVGASKNTIKIIGEETPMFAQGYFVYDPKKSGGMTVSHLRFGPGPIRAPWLVRGADFIAVHQPSLLRQRPDILDEAAPGATILFNFSGGDRELWAALSPRAREVVRKRGCALYRIDASAVAKECGIGRHINVVMQAAFFVLGGILPQEEALERIQEAVRATYAGKGAAVVRSNCAAVLAAPAALAKVEIPALDDEPAAPNEQHGWMKDCEDKFVMNVTLPLMRGLGDGLPVSAIPADGAWPTGTSRYEKRAVAESVPLWSGVGCIQCNQCVMACPHAGLRSTFVSTLELEDAPDGYRSIPYKGAGAREGERFTVQVSPADCTGCGLCEAVCPREGSLSMQILDEKTLEREGGYWKYFDALAGPPRERLDAGPRTLPMRRPLFEFSGACAGCGQTPYVRTLTQLFGDQLIMANAAGCSSVYGGNLPTAPYCKDAEGRGPAWANSLFEDNAEFGYGLMLSTRRRRDAALSALARLEGRLPNDLVTALGEDARDEAAVAVIRGHVDRLREILAGMDGDEAARDLLQNADHLVRKTVWTIGGDGWAYDIGYGGLDHVLAGGRDVNILVLDTEVYSNTGGQQSKATPLGATVRFAAGGKAIAKKDLTGIIMNYGYIYVAQISLGANPRQAIEALREAESYDGPSLIVAYAPCIEHGVDLAQSFERQKLAVKTGYWSLFRFDPRRAAAGESALRLDSPKPSVPVAEFMRGENRFRRLMESTSEREGTILRQAQENVDRRYAQLQTMSIVGVKS